MGKLSQQLLIIVSVPDINLDIVTLVIFFSRLQRVLKRLRLSQMVNGTQLIISLDLKRGWIHTDLRDR